MAQVKLLPIKDFLGRDWLDEQSSQAEGSWAWFETIAATTLGPGEEAMFAVAFDPSGMARAALPLAVAPDASLRSLTAPYTTRYCPALNDPEWALYLGEQARGYVKTTMRLDALDLADAGMNAYLAGLARSGLSQAMFDHFGNWFEDIGDFEDYWASRATRLQTTVRRKLNIACRNHSVRFSVSGDPAALSLAARDYLDVYSSSWKKPEPHPDFISTLIHKLGKDGSVRLGTLIFDDVVAAAQIWLVHGRRATIFKLAHRQAFAHLSPGTLLTHWLLQSICRESQPWEIDFGRGDDDYKRDWLKNRRQRYGSISANWRSGAGVKALFSQIYPTRMSRLRKKVPISS